MRIAAGVCVLAVGLMFGSGALAVADSEPSSSTGPSQGADGASQGTGSAGDTSGSKLSSEPDTDPSTPADDPKGSTGSTSLSGSEDDSTSELGTKEDEEASGGEDDESLGSGSETETSGEEVTESETGSEPPGTTAPEPTGTSTGSTTPATSQPTPAVTPPAAPPPNPLGPVWKAFKPLGTTVENLSDVVRSVPETLAALSTSRTPIYDAIGSIQEMLTSVADAVKPLGDVPAGVYQLFGIPISTTPAPPLIGGSGALDAMRATAPAEAPLFGPQAGQVQQVVPYIADKTPLFGSMAPRQTLGQATGVPTRNLSVSGTVPLKRGAPSSPQSLFEHVIEAVLVPASLTALAAVALPGVGGLLVVCAAGVRFGYRQAKAALALRASGIARFAGPGPLGVVRSGSRVMLRQRARGPRAKRAVCPEAARAARNLEHVA